MQRQNTLFQKIHLEYKDIKHKREIKSNATTKYTFAENLS